MSRLPEEPAALARAAPSPASAHHLSDVRIVLGTTAGLEVSEPGDPLELEADRMAGEVMSSGDVGAQERPKIVRPGRRSIQRAPDGPDPSPPTPDAGTASPLAGSSGAGSTTILDPTLGFDVYHGGTLKEIADALPTESGSLTFDISTATDGDPITRATVTVKQEMRLPKWAERDKQCRPVQTAWDSFMSALRVHEDGHVAVNRRELGSAHTQYAGKPAADTQTVTGSLEQKATAAGNAFDTQTDHGRKASPPTTIDLAAKCADAGTATEENAGAAVAENEPEASESPDAAAVQTKLEVSQPGDPDEEEADRVAEQVMRLEAPRDLQVSGGVRVARRIQRCAACEDAEARAKVDGSVPEKCAECDAKERAERVSRKEASARPVVEASSQVVDVTKSGGQPIDAETRAFMEPRFGFDFSRVRVHADADAAEASHSIHARAFTLGSDIVFGAGQYAPQTEVGRRLFAHELTHVVQQGRAAGSVVQRGIVPGFLRSDKGTKEEIAAAIKSEDPADIKAIDDFSNADETQKAQLIQILLNKTNLWTFDKRAMARIWNSFADHESLNENQVALLRTCIDRGFDPKDLKRYPWFEDDFRASVKREVTENLMQNTTVVQKEADRLGLTGDKPKEGEHYDEEMSKLQDLAALIKDAKVMLARARNIIVAHTGTLEHLRTPGAVPFGGQPIKFDPENRPDRPDEPVTEPNKDRNEMPWGAVYPAYASLTQTIASVLAQNPALYALQILGEPMQQSTPTKPGQDAQLVYGEQSRLSGFEMMGTKEAREKVGKALLDVYNNGRITLVNVMGGTMSPLQFDLVVQRHRQGQHGPRWATPYAKLIADHAVAHDESSFDKTMEMITIVLVLGAVAIGTGGAATPLLGAILSGANIASAAAAAANKTFEAENAQKAAQSGASPNTAVTSQQQADRAALDAQMYQFMAIAVFAGEALGPLLPEARAGMNLGAIDMLAPAERAATVKDALQTMEVGQVALRTHLAPEEMLQVLTASGASDAETASAIGKVRDFLNQLKGPVVGPTAGDEKTIASLLRQAKYTIAEYWNRVQGLGFREVDSVSLHSGFGDAELTYVKLIEDTPGREAGIYRNARTGEHSVVQGSGNWSTTGSVQHMENLPEAAGDRWILVEHYHPERNFAVQFPSGASGDFAVLLEDYGETNVTGVLEGQRPTVITKRVEATIRYRDPRTGTYYFTTYGYDPAQYEIGAFFVSAKTESGAVVDYSFRNISGLAGARSDWERHMLGLQTGQPIVRAAP